LSIERVSGAALKVLGSIQDSKDLIPKVFWFSERETETETEINKEMEVCCL
jgi:hypothetical protein